MGELPSHISPGASGTLVRSRHRATLDALDAVLFVPVFVLVAEDNTSPARVPTLAEARAAVAVGAAASVAGKLAPGLLAADIDAADAVTGDACAELLVRWCVRHGLRYVLRDSGRPGGRHVIAAVTDPGVPVREWRRLCWRLSAQHSTVVQDRTGQHLRLLTAPHRTGRPCPVIACTLTPADVQDALRTTTRIRRRSRAAARRRRSDPSRSPVDRSRSASEFGECCAMRRKGYTARQAWQLIARRRGHAADRGAQWWQRYMWLPVVTTVAAEQGLAEADAWALVRHECPQACLQHGQAWWRADKWLPALAEAAQDRPRRYRVDDTPQQPEAAAEIATVRAGLSTAVDTVMQDAHPSRRRSMHAALHWLAWAVVARGGSISVRDLSIRALLDPKTVQRRLADAQALGLIVTTHAYSGGSADCSAYAIGPAALDHITEAREKKSHTRCTTPCGRANPARLRRLAAHDRRLWALRCDLLAALGPGERLRDSQHPAAKQLRSIHHQRGWWRSLSDAEQAERRANRQRFLRQLDPADRSAWFDWLRRRELVYNAADQLPGHRLDAEGLHTLTTAPLTVHRGMADPLWRTGGTPATAAA